MVVERQTPSQAANECGGASVPAGRAAPSRLSGPGSASRLAHPHRKLIVIQGGDLYDRRVRTPTVTGVMSPNRWIGRATWG